MHVKLLRQLGDGPFVPNVGEQRLSRKLSEKASAFYRVRDGSIDAGGVLRLDPPAKPPAR
ncbi:MAG: hypothetical protein JWM41_4065 [Gemmatimonadetes bacterium]|nr:hypothetical protein [Gemmatimonadota bacterium]